MYQALHRVKDFKPEEIDVTVELDDTAPIKVWDKSLNVIMFSLSIEEATTICEKIGFALLDYQAQLKEKRIGV